MKGYIKYLALILAALAIISLSSCKEKDGGEEETCELPKLPAYSQLALEAYIKPFSYTGLTVTVAEGEQKYEAVWRQIVASVEIIEYPAAHVEYYVEQEKAKYRYFAKRDGIEYEALLEGLGVTEDSILANARELVREDLVLEYIIRDGGIALTDTEKAELTDKYAEKLTAVYGGDREYIKANMPERIYDAMLHDKVMEYLLLNNEFSE